MRNSHSEITALSLLIVEWLQYQSHNNKIEGDIAQHIYMYTIMHSQGDRPRRLFLLENNLSIWRCSCVHTAAKQHGTWFPLYNVLLTLPNGIECIAAFGNVHSYIVKSGYWLPLKFHQGIKFQDRTLDILYWISKCMFFSVRVEL